MKSGHPNSECSWLRPRRLVTAALSCALLGACASAAPPPGPPPEHSVARWTQRLQLESLPRPGRFEVRYNPGPCEGPAWELRAPGGWVRAVLRASSAEREAILRAVSDQARTAVQAGREGEVFEVWAEPEDEVSLAPPLSVPVLIVELLEPPPPAESPNE